jgi:hypothetical protein
MTRHSYFSLKGGSKPAAPSASADNTPTSKDEPTRMPPPLHPGEVPAYFPEGLPAEFDALKYGGVGFQSFDRPGPKGTERCAGIVASMMEIRSNGDAFSSFEVFASRSDIGNSKHPDREKILADLDHYNDRYVFGSTPSPPAQDMLAAAAEADKSIQTNKTEIKTAGPTDKGTSLFHKLNKTTLS